MELKGEIGLEIELLEVIRIIMVTKVTEIDCDLLGTCVLVTEVRKRYVST